LSLKVVAPGSRTGMRRRQTRTNGMSCRIPCGYAPVVVVPACSGGRLFRSIFVQRKAFLALLRLLSLAIIHLRPWLTDRLDGGSASEDSARSEGLHPFGRETARPAAPVDDRRLDLGLDQDLAGAQNALVHHDTRTGKLLGARLDD